jgi:hypothetical protein
MRKRDNNKMREYENYGAIEEESNRSREKKSEREYTRLGKHRGRERDHKMWE